VEVNLGYTVACDNLRIALEEVTAIHNGFVHFFLNLSHNCYCFIVFDGAKIGYFELICKKILIFNKTLTDVLN